MKRKRCIGQEWSTSSNACIVTFDGGGPYDGLSGLWDHQNWHAIGVCENGLQYAYRKSGDRRYSLHSIWVKGREFSCHEWAVTKCLGE